MVTFMQFPLFCILKIKVNIYNMRNSVLAIIPARGGSKGIPRKNLRPIAGKPMIYYSIHAARQSQSVSEVVVTTDDDEIALIASRFGAKVIIRPKNLGEDITTLDPVIKHAALAAEDLFGQEFETVVTIQPTSPLVTANDIDQVVFKLRSSGADTVLTATDDRHLCWTAQNGQYVPEYKARVNRQQLPSRYKETGAVVACSKEQLQLTGTRVGSHIELHLIESNRSFDIDTFEDLALCEYILGRKKIVFNVVGYPEVGLGHAFRAVTLANELVQYDLVFICENKSKLAADYIKSFNYNVIICEDGQLAEAVGEENCDLVINDILDTTHDYMEKLKRFNIKVINFEDLSEASKSADAVFNALYPNSPNKNAYSGVKYFCLRDEFIYTQQKSFSESVENILLTFGGVDEGNITYKVLDIIAELNFNCNVDVVLGPGYQHKNTLSQFEGIDNINIVESTKNISDYMKKADLAITSGGRTVLELASLAVPTLVICQNERETTHSFLDSDNGVLNLGFYGEVTRQDIISAVTELFHNSETRLSMHKKMNDIDLLKGKLRVINRIKQIVG